MTRINMRYLFKYLLALFILYLSAVPTAQARVYLDIAAAEFRAIPMAVPWFSDKLQPDKSHDFGTEMADIISRGLKLHGFISIIDPKSYNGSKQSSWQELGAHFVVLGQYSTDYAGNIVLDIRLVDTQVNRMILGRRYTGAWDNRREMILEFCDKIILKLTGEPGISRSRIAFVSDKTNHKEIYLTDVLGDEVRQVTRHRNLALSPRFSVNGLKLAYTSYHRGNPDLYVTDLRQTKITQAVSRHRGLNMAPAWAPDGKTMAITLSKDGNPDLYLINLKGEIKQRLTVNKGINVSPSWSPDGRQLAFTSDRSGNPQIYIMDIPSKAVRRITYIGNENTTPSWSPDGKWLAYTAAIEGNNHIMIIKPTGGNPVRITRYWGDHESPTWSPDSKQIAFSLKRHDQQHIAAIFRNGQGFRTLFRMEGNQSSPQWASRMEF